MPSGKRRYTHTQNVSSHHKQKRYHNNLSTVAGCCISRSHVDLHKKSLDQPESICVHSGVDTPKNLAALQVLLIANPGVPNTWVHHGVWAVMATCQKTLCGGGRDFALLSSMRAHLIPGMHEVQRVRCAPNTWVHHRRRRVLLSDVGHLRPCGASLPWLRRSGRCSRCWCRGY